MTCTRRELCVCGILNKRSAVHLHKTDICKFIFGNKLCLTALRVMKKKWFFVCFLVFIRLSLIVAEER